MITSKRTVTAFLKDKFPPMPDGEKRALFEREAKTLFKEYRKWYQDNNWGKSPSGVKEPLFKKWLTENDCFFVSKKMRKSPITSDHILSGGSDTLDHILSEGLDIEKF